MTRALRKCLAGLMVRAFMIFPLAVRRLCSRQLHEDIALRSVAIRWGALNSAQRARFLDANGSEIIALLREEGML
ncbi:hypothetical protein H2509_09915 [Stappia sp. F7233]|uniref:Uncharacterized protein n=1 Tax=Stappia albiluteola TaxID=2758565 RepID=A0A839AFW1_9HYPH|nr:hypothetical protein [Stappia albiluteola]MBA5777439.1 hypothetical protein [Stappia albiluteola]